MKVKLIKLTKDYYNELKKMIDEWKIDQEIKRKKGPEKPKPGKRTEFLAKYKVVGYEKAKEIINKDFGREVFNDGILKKWIKEESEK